MIDNSVSFAKPDFRISHRNSGAIMPTSSASRKISLLTALILQSTVLFFSHSANADNTLTESEAETGWQLLFDGNDLSQWRNYRHEAINPQWLIEDGTMVLSAGGGGDLITRESYRNFDLKLEWNIAEVGNSGIFFLADEREGTIYFNAPEVQLLDNERHPDNKQANRLSGSLYDLIGSPPASHKIAGQWNTLRIQHLNKQLKVWQNDVLTVDINIGSARWNELVAGSKFVEWSGFGKNEEGHIGIQDHGDQVAFKNLRIRRL